jgi:hypothetical protein
LSTKWVNNHTTLALAIVQFRGYKNCNAPENLYNLVKDELCKFNGIDYKLVNSKKDELFDINDIF